MLILGVHGGTRFEGENDKHNFAFHDSAAVLFRGSEIVAAIEEERLSRVKHTNNFPLHAIRYCLEEGGCTLDEVDVIATNSSIFHADLFAKTAMIEDPTNRLSPDGRTHLAALFQRAFGVQVGRKLYFCNHHLSHAWSTFALSGFDSSLILSIDGDGDGCSGMVLKGAGRRITKLREFAIPQSLGQIYLELIQIVGYYRFDEYKVMGLAPYGDPKRFAPLFEKCYRLLPNGDYGIEPLITWMAYLDSAGLLKDARRKGDPFTQIHKDFAAALQDMIEKIVLHVLRHYREQTQHRTLCLAGGVAHNCTMNGKVLYSGLFDQVFVQPAAHDAGGALGAALCALHEHDRNATAKKLTHVYFGTDVGTDTEQRELLDGWSEFVQYEEEKNIAGRTAQLLAEGAVIGWIQGRSEFGPRALGNRSILADPRPAENKLRINQMIKKREEYRPFAPSVLEEKVSEYFHVPAAQTQFPFMIFVLSVREHVQDLLGAITHVDGTARVQTVSRETNPLYWQLIYEFEKLTGVPILLNTSFNNNAEPIVDSLEDAIVCFLTTGINYLVVGNLVVTKAPAEKVRQGLRSLAPEFPVMRKLVQRRLGWNRQEAVFEIESTKSKHFGTPIVGISREMYEALQDADGQTGFGSLMERAGIKKQEEERLLDELIDLWSQRIIRLRAVRMRASLEEVNMDGNHLLQTAIRQV